MSGWHRRIVALLLAAMALAPAAMAAQRSGSLRVTVEVVAQCSVASGSGATLHQTCSAARAEGVVVATPLPSVAPASSEPVQRQHTDGQLTVIY